MYQMESLASPKSPMEDVVVVNESMWQTGAMEFFKTPESNN